MGFQSGVQGDYYRYFDYFKDIQTGSSFYHNTEVGWMLLNKIFFFYLIFFIYIYNIIFAIYHIMQIC
jgi:hypothetical protein